MKLATSGRLGEFSCPGIPPLSALRAATVTFDYNWRVRSFRVGALVNASRGGPGVGVASLSGLAKRLGTVGADALFVRSSTALAIEPVTLLAALAVESDLVLGAVVPLAGGRNPAVVTKLATTLALLAPGRCTIIFEADGNEESLVEAMIVAKALMGEGPIDAGGEHYVVRGAWNEPRPRRLDLPSVGALVDVVTDQVAEVADLILARAVRWRSPAAIAGEVVRLCDEETPPLPPGEPVVVEITTGDLDHIAAVVAKLAAGEQ